MFDIGGWEFLLIVGGRPFDNWAQGSAACYSNNYSLDPKARSLAEEFRYNLDVSLPKQKLIKSKPILLPILVSRHETEIEIYKGGIDPHGDLDTSIQSFRNSIDNHESLKIASRRQP